MNVMQASPEFKISIIILHHLLFLSTPRTMLTAFPQAAVPPSISKLRLATCLPTILPVADELQFVPLIDTERLKT